MNDIDWLNVEVGDALVDPHTGVRREVFTVKRTANQRGQLRGVTRVSVHVTNLKQPGRTTVMFSTDGVRSRCLCLEKKPMAGAIEYRDPGDEHSPPHPLPKARVL